MDRNHFGIAKKYAEDIVQKKAAANVERLQACQRFLRDLENPAYEIKSYDAEFVIGIIEKTFVHIKGPMKGKPFLLVPWEIFIVYNLLGFYLKGTDERRFKEALIFIPRKNGKTPFSAALAWALAVLERKYASSIYIVGSVLKQAIESFNIIKRNLRMGGMLEEFRVLDNNSEHSISKIFYDDDDQEVGAIHIEALASNPDGQDGLNCNIAICDEMHAYKNSNQYTIIKDAMKAYVNKLLIGITTAGKTMNSFCYRRLLYCQRVLRDEVKDEQYFIFICKADQDEHGNVDYTNPVEHEKANPNYGVTIRPVDILNDALQAQNDPEVRNNFFNKSLNIYTNALNTYFNMAEVQDSDRTHRWTLEELAKLPVIWFGGADLSKMHDLTGACIYGEYNGVAITITHGFIPLITATKKAEEDEIPFFGWKDDGWLMMCNSEIVDYGDVVKWFIEMRAMGFKIKLVGFDRRYSRDFVLSMESHKFKMVDQDQAYWKKSEGFREIENKIKTRRFYYLHSEAFEYCISNVKAVEDSNDKVKFEKVTETQRIDLFDCSIIACLQWLYNKQKKAKAKEWLG